MVPFAQLSRGEQSRANLARVLAHGAERGRSSSVLVVEEFTSLVDRATAKLMSGRIQQFLMRTPEMVLAGPRVLSCRHRWLWTAGAQMGL